MCVCVCWAQQTHRHFPTHIRHLGLGLHHVTHFATIVFYLGFCWFRAPPLEEHGWAAGLWAIAPSKKWIFWEEANGAGHKQYLHNVYTISKRATSIRARNTWSTEFLWASRIRAKTWIGLCTCWTRKRNDIAISRATAGTNTNKLCPRERHLMTASNVWFQVTHTTHVLVSVGNGSWMLLSGTSMQDQGW